MLTEFLLYGISPYRQTFQVTEQLEGLQLSQPLESVTGVFILYEISCLLILSSAKLDWKERLRHSDTSLKLL